MDPEQPPDEVEPMPPPGGERSGRYRLPGPLSQRDTPPLAPGAPRIPRALRAFNGMPPDGGDGAPATPTGSRPGGPGPRGRGRDGLTIRDLLEARPEEAAEQGRFAGLRAALGRLRRSGRGEDG